MFTYVDLKPVCIKCAYGITTRNLLMQIALLQLYEFNKEKVGYSLFTVFLDTAIVLPTNKVRGSC